jgi:Polyketide cyclase / dehydrase and lipid transport
MMDVESYPKRWNLKRVTVLEKTDKRVRYELELNIRLAPKIPGIVENPTSGKVVFTDPETGGQFIFTMEQTEHGCSVSYNLLEAKGKPGGWTGVVRTLEESAVDAANVAAALSSMRGYARPEEQAGAQRTQVPPAGHRAFAALATHGTAMRVVRQPGRVPTVIVRRVVTRPIGDVLWNIRDRRRYEDKIAVITEVEDEGDGVVEYDVAAFGGRVSFDTRQIEKGDPSTGVTIEERVVGGDVKHGRWEWRVTPVPGGTDVQLTWDFDIVSGSSVMLGLATIDPMARESMGFHFALAMIGELVGGSALGPRAIASAP